MTEYISEVMCCRECGVLTVLPGVGRICCQPPAGVVLVWGVCVRCREVAMEVGGDG